MRNLPIQPDWRNRVEFAEHEYIDWAGFVSSSANPHTHQQTQSNHAPRIKEFISDSTNTPARRPGCGANAARDVV